MVKLKYYGLVIALVCLLMFAPVAACSHWWNSKTGSDASCFASEITYTISVGVTDGSGQKVKIVDELPDGVTYVDGSASDGGTYVAGSPNKVVWLLTVPSSPNPWSKSVTLKVTKPAGPLSVTNVAKYYWGWTSTTPIVAQTTFDTIVECEGAPEFPTIALPAGMIIGFLGVVLFVRRTKE